MVLVKQAPEILRSRLANVLAPMQTKPRFTESAAERVTLTGDVAFFAVAFSTTKRGAELTATLIQRILRLANESGLLFNFQWGKTQRDGADHLVTVSYEEEFIASCPVRAVEQLVREATGACWDMTRGYLFSDLSKDEHEKPLRGSAP